MYYICLLCVSVSSVWFVPWYRADPNVIITIQDATGFVRVDDVNGILANLSTANVTFLPVQRYGNPTFSH